MTRIASQTLGSATVTVLTDGALNFGPDLFPGTAPEHITELLAQQNADGIATNFNAVLIRNAGRTILCDAGPRELMGPTSGFLPDALNEAGVTPAEVDTLFATHLHPDHIAGMITPQGAACFPNAELVVTQGEHAFWGNESVTQGLPAPLSDWAALARSVLAAYKDRLRIVTANAEIAPGLTAFPLAGHTPGHSGWRLDSGGVQLLHVGDIIHAPVLQAADPNIAIAFDMDADTARETRKRILDQAASDRALFTGGHFLHPAFYRAERQGTGYNLVRP